MKKLYISIDPGLEEAGKCFLANIYSIKGNPGRGEERTNYRGLIVVAGPDEGITVDVVEGKYLIEVVFPSGAVLQKDTVVSSSDNIVNVAFEVYDTWKNLHRRQSFSSEPSEWIENHGGDLVGSRGDFGLLFGSWKGLWTADDFNIEVEDVNDNLEQVINDSEDEESEIYCDEQCEEEDDEYCRCLVGAASLCQGNFREAVNRTREYYLVGIGPVARSYPRNLGFRETGRDWSTSYQPLISWSSLHGLVNMPLRQLNKKMKSRLRYIKKHNRLGFLESAPVLSRDDEWNLQKIDIAMFENSFKHENLYRWNPVNKCLFVLKDRNVGWNLSLMPLPWKGAHPDAGSVKLYVQGEASLRSNRLSNIKIVINDDVIGSMLGYFERGDMLSAALLMDKAKEALFRKMDNPIAAAAGGYILVATETDLEYKDWHEWVYNLSELFPHVADGAIIYGWSKLRHAKNEEDENIARDALLNGYWRGIPFFTTGVRLLLDGLTLLRNSAREKGFEVNRP